MFQFARFADVCLCTTTISIIGTEELLLLVMCCYYLQVGRAQTPRHKYQMILICTYQIHSGRTSMEYIFHLNIEVRLQHRAQLQRLLNAAPRSASGIFLAK